MARSIKQGQHIFIAFQDGEAVLDSQLRPRMYKSREQFEKSFPAWRDGKAELVEYAPTLTPPNEWVSVEEGLPDAEKEVRLFCVNTNVRGFMFHQGCAGMILIIPGTGNAATSMTKIRMTTLLTLDGMKVAIAGMSIRLLGLRIR